MNQFRWMLWSGALTNIALMALLMTGTPIIAVNLAAVEAIAQEETRPLAPSPGGQHGLRGDNRGGLWAPEAEVLVTFVVFIGVIMGVYFYLRSLPTEDKPRRRR